VEKRQKKKKRRPGGALTGLLIKCGGSAARKGRARGGGGGTLPRQIKTGYRSRKSRKEFGEHREKRRGPPEDEGKKIGSRDPAPKASTRIIGKERKDK